MSATQPFILSERQTQLLHALSAELAPSGLLWASGFLAGRAAQGELLVAANEAPAAHAQATLTVLYGSQTGNARRLAERFAREGEAAGLRVRLVDAADYAPRDLKDERYLLVVISTQGDGEPPDGARGFVEFIAGRRAPRLEALKYAVLALGDSSYPDFCTIGRQVDERLAALGAQRLRERGDCDLDIDTVANPWWGAALELARTELAQPAAHHGATVIPLRRPAAPAHGRDQPFAAPLLANQRITARDTDKDVRHVELSLEGSGLHYEPGDALGVWHVNPPGLVQAVLDVLQLDGDAEVAHKDQTRPLREWLGRERELTGLARPFLQQHAERAGHSDLHAALAEGAREPLAALLASHQLIDVLRRYPARWSADELVAALRPLAPRLYSIASSPALAEGEVHLTVARVAYDAFGLPHLGAASNHLAGLDEDASVPVYVEENRHFRLPQDGARDVIMIGPGTGVAPFRAFVQHRQALGATGRNWLFFGAQHAHSQFLYQLEWQQALKEKALHRIDLAFSRDQAEKLYVQQRLREHGAEVYDWLQGGAHLYVCGGTDMGRQVHAALRDVVVPHLQGDAERADEYLAQLQRDGRYCRDVY